MKLATRERDGITILAPKGKITIGEGDIELRESIHRALNEGFQKILIDLKGATRMDSSGIAELVAAYTMVTGHGGELKLLNLPRKIEDVLGVTQIVSVFDVFDSEEEAVASYN